MCNYTFIFISSTEMPLTSTRKCMYEREVSENSAQWIRLVQTVLKKLVRPVFLSALFNI